MFLTCRNQYDFKTSVTDNISIKCFFYFIYNSKKISYSKLKLCFTFYFNLDTLGEIVKNKKDFVSQKRTIRRNLRRFVSA